MGQSDNEAVLNYGNYRLVMSGLTLISLWVLPATGYWWQRGFSS